MIDELAQRRQRRAYPRVERTLARGTFGIGWRVSSWVIMGPTVKPQEIYAPVFFWRMSEALRFIEETPKR
jgi:hypothetical protein